MTAEPHEVFQGYELLQRIVAGQMSEAFQARQLATGRIVFLKRVHVVSRQHRDAIEREIEVYTKLRRLQNPHVLEVIDFPTDGLYQGIVTEFADGDLEFFVRHFGRGSGLPLVKVKEIALELAPALALVHAHNIVHRDLKPSNVLSAGGKLKLADFGIAKNVSVMHSKKSFKTFGTKGFAAPEQFAGVHAHASADVYSFGKLLVFLLTGQEDSTNLPDPRWRDLVLRCLHMDPNVRPTMQEVADEIRCMPMK